MADKKEVNEDIQVIVTVKLSKNKYHDIHNKKSGPCPLDNNIICTDLTGAHHSILVKGKNLQEVKNKVNKKYSHITRIEVIK